MPAGDAPTPHFIVEPGSALGVSLRLPREATPWLIAMTGGRITTEMLEAAGEELPSLYFTQGSGTLDGEPHAHRFVTVVNDPPPWADRDPAIMIAGVFAEENHASGQLFERAGFSHYPGRFVMDVAPDERSAHLELSAAGVSMDAEATFEDETEPWEWTVTYFTLVPTPPLGGGHEQGIRHEGTARVRFQSTKGSETLQFTCASGLDRELGWNITLGPEPTP